MLSTSSNHWFRFSFSFPFASIIYRYLLWTFMSCLSRSSDCSTVTVVIFIEYRRLLIAPDVLIILLLIFDISSKRVDILNSRPFSVIFLECTTQFCFATAFSGSSITGSISSLLYAPVNSGMFTSGTSTWKPVPDTWFSTSSYSNILLTKFAKFSKLSILYYLM